jgi:hypothetical protein
VLRPFRDVVFEVMLVTLGLNGLYERRLARRGRAATRPALERASLAAAAEGGGRDSAADAAPAPAAPRLAAPGVAVRAP